MRNSIFLTITLFVVGVEPAFAYIDPGSGSAIMSVIIGVFVAIGVLVKVFWYKIKGILGLSKTRKNGASDDVGLEDQSKDSE